LKSFKTFDYVITYKDDHGVKRHSVLLAKDAYHAQLSFEEMVGDECASLISIRQAKEEFMWD